MAAKEFLNELVLVRVEEGGGGALFNPERSLFRKEAALFFKPSKKKIGDKIGRNNPPPALQKNRCSPNSCVQNLFFWKEKKIGLSD